MNTDYIGSDYESFPHSTAMSEGIHILQANEEEVSMRVLCDVPYRYIDQKQLHLHIILPTQDKESEEVFPLIVYVQGSAWQEQSTGKELAQLCKMARKGYVIAIVQYRHSTWAPFPAQIIDTKYAIQFLVEHAKEYKIDTENIILWGDSSGAHTALMSAFTQGIETFKEDSIKEYNIRCVIDYYGPTDISVMGEEPSVHDHYGPLSPEGLLIGGKTVNKESAKKTIVMNYVNEKEIPPLIIFHGSKDRQVPFQQSVLLYNEMKKYHKKVECYQIYGADHGGSAFWSKEVLDIVDEFIRKYIK